MGAGFGLALKEAAMGTLVLKEEETEQSLLIYLVIN